MRVFLVAVTTVLTALLFGGVAQATEITVLSSNGMAEVMKVLGPRFEAATGNTLIVHYDVANVLKQRIVAGEAFDVAILTGPAMDEMVRSGKVDPATRTVIARSGVGVAYKTGSPAPDIHDAAAFRSTMLAARSVAYTTTGASGLYFISVCEKLGIDQQVKAKAKVIQSGPAAALVANGEAELAAQQISELLPVPGVTVIALPPELQNYTAFPGAVGAASAHPQAAAALIAFLTDPASAGVIRAKGMEPGGPVAQAAQPSPTPLAFSAHAHATFTAKSSTRILSGTVRLAIAQRGNLSRVDILSMKSDGMPLPPSLFQLTLVVDRTARTVTMWSDSTKKYHVQSIPVSPLSSPMATSSQTSPLSSLDLFEFSMNLAGHTTTMGFHTTDFAFKMKLRAKGQAVTTHIAGAMNLAEDFQWFPITLDFSVTTGTSSSGMKIVYLLDDLKAELPPGDPFAVPAGYTQSASFLDVFMHVPTALPTPGATPTTAPGTVPQPVPSARPR
jgi:molybdate transport system substrate-binding protein